ncbi:MAG TPA: hypothetical protein VKB52_12635 [Rhodanobacteraceae bacterium]|nr:hypothetical protein [Rhodanobacteraceae bacterium]
MIAVVVVARHPRDAASSASRVARDVDATVKEDSPAPPRKAVGAGSPKAARAAVSRARQTGTDDAWIPADRTGPSFATIREGLLAAAQAGDADAASELSHATQFCRWAKQQGDVEDPTPLLVRDGNWNALPDATRAENLRLIDNWRRSLAAVERNRWYCAGTEAIVADDRAMLDAELMAARLGDAQAADCFVSSAAMFATPGTHMGPNPDYDAAVAKPFAEAALEIATQGVERGDWRMVAVLALAYSNQGANGYSFVLAQPDPVRYYAYGVLSRLGHNDPEQLEREREMPLDPAAIGVDADTARAMEAWAEETYERYFLSSEPLPYSSYYVCDPP